MSKGLHAETVASRSRTTRLDGRRIDGVGYAGVPDSGTVTYKAGILNEKLLRKTLRYTFNFPKSTTIVGRNEKVC